MIFLEPAYNLVLSWRFPDGRYQTTWAFVLEQSPPGQTRLINFPRRGKRRLGCSEWPPPCSAHGERRIRIHFTMPKVEP